MKTTAITTFLSWRFQLLPISVLPVWQTVSVSECLLLLSLVPVQHLCLFWGQNNYKHSLNLKFWSILGLQKISGFFCHPILNALEAYLSLYLLTLSENDQKSLFKFFAKQYFMISGLNISGVFLNVAYFILTFPLLADTILRLFCIFWHFAFSLTVQTHFRNCLCNHKTEN